MKLVIAATLLNLAILICAFIIYKSSKPDTAEDYFFPTIAAYDESFLQVSDIHKIWYGQYGNPNGVPVIVLHGGPGAGTSANDMRFFDPKFYRIILMDQRGAGKSTPAAELKENTTQNLISDIESLRLHLNIDKWVVFGGSWGSALSLAYGQLHPEKCLGFILRGIFLGTKAEGDQLWYGMKDVFPDAWQELVDFLPSEEQNDLPGSYYKRLLDPDKDIYMPAARSFTKYDMTSAFLEISPDTLQAILSDDKTTYNLSKIFTHYYMNGFFLQDNQIMDNLHKINSLPLFIVHGRYDIICRAQSAWKLHKKWPNSKLTLVDAAGHSAKETGIVKALVKATELMKGFKS